MKIFSFVYTVLHYIAAIVIAYNETGINFLLP